MKYYVYLHIKADTGEPFYVGKGNKGRAIKKRDRSIFWNNIVDKHGFEVIYLEENLTEEESLEKETYWIKRIGRRDLGLGPLVNHTNGGEGSSGFKHSEESRLKMSIIRKGKKKKPLSDESKKNISESLKGKTAWNKGKKTGPLSDERRSKINTSLSKNPKAKKIVFDGIEYGCWKELWLDKFKETISYSRFTYKLSKNEFLNK